MVEATEIRSAESNLKSRIIQIGLVILIVLVLGAPTLLHPFGKDQGEYAYIGAAFLNGAAIYKDVFNVKPPMTHWLHAAATTLFGPYMSAIRILDLLWQLGTALCLFGIGLRLLRRWWGWGFLAAVFYAVTYYHTDFWHTAQTDGFINFPIALSVFLVIDGLSGDKVKGWVKGWQWFAAGFLIALAVLLKYPIGLMLPVLIIIYWLAAPKRENRPIAFMISGFSLPLVLFLLGLLARGALGDFLEIQLGYIPEYNAGFVTADNYLAFSWQIFNSVLTTDLKLQIFLLVLGASFLVLLFNRPKNRLLWLLPMWGFAALVHLVIQNKYYPYHALPLLAPLALMVAYLFQSLSALFDRIKPRARYVFGAGAAVLLVFMIVSPYSPYSYGDLSERYKPLMSIAKGEMTLIDYYKQDIFGAYGWPVFSSRANLEAADYLFSHSQPEDEVFIWAFEPAIYFLSQRQSASRFIYNFPLYGRFAWPAFRESVVAELTADPPQVVLVANGDAQPWLTGTEIDSAGALREFPALNDFINEQYRFDTNIAQFSIYQRR
jgi:hypothetical protein